MTTISSLFLSSLAVVLLCVALVPKSVADDSVWSVYEKWMSDFGRVYKSDTEKHQRFEVFKANFQFVESTNKKPGLSYKVGLNEFADLTNEEFKAKYVGYKSPSGPKKATAFKYANLTTVPASIDWRTYGAVTPIKDQGNCGRLKL